MRLLQNRRAATFVGADGFLAGLLSMWFFIGVARAETPVISLWSGEGHEGYTSFDVLDTNQFYPVTRVVKINARLDNPATNPPVQVDDFVISCTVPPHLGMGIAEFEDPFYVQWNAAATSFVYRAAVPMTNECSWWPDLSLVSSNGWAKPKIRVERSASPTLVPAGQSVTQTFVIAAQVPAGALAGCEMLMFQVDANDIEESEVSLTGITGVCSSAAFYANEIQGMPYFFTEAASGLSGLYTFTSTLLVTNAGSSDIHFMPGAQTEYVEEQTPWAHRVSGTVLTHSYTNGIIVRASAPVPVDWWDQQHKDRFYWHMAPKWTRPGDDTPALESIYLISGSVVGYDGTSFQQLMLDARGVNLVAATVSAPGGQLYSLGAEEGTCFLELASRTASDLSAFGNGTYTIRLYDFTNGLRQTYSLFRFGLPVTQTPQLLAPQGLTITNARPAFSWAPITDLSANSGMLVVQNHQFDEDQQAIWVGSVTNQDNVVSTDMFAGCGYQLLFGSSMTGAVNGASYITSYVSGRFGLFNVVTNGSNLAFARGATAVPRVFVGQSMDMGLFEYGFLPGSNFTFSVDFGDGSAANGSLATHAYAVPGAYTQRFIALDNTGVAGTGLTTTIVYDMPRIMGIWPTNGASHAIGFDTIEGASYRAAHSDDLINWGGTLTNLIGDGETHVVEDPVNPGAPRRFYRLEVDLNP